MAQKKRKPKLILPVGVAVFPHLNEVDVYQPQSGAEKRRYITYVRYEDVNAVKALIKAYAKEHLGVTEDDYKLPFKKIKKDKESKEKELVLVAASGEKYRPSLWDAKNQSIPISVVIGGGSKVRLDVSPKWYDGFGGGVNLYLNAVQVLDLVEGGFSRESSFEEAEGFAVGEEEAEATDHNEQEADESAFDL